MGLLILAVLLTLVACFPQQILSSPEPDLTPQVTPTPAASVDEQLREAFRLADPDVRREFVLRLVEALLRDETFGRMDDEAASSYFTTVAFESERLIFADPAFVRRRGNLAVVGMPDGLGLFLYDLSQEPGVPPLELSHWTVGLSAVDVTWRAGEIGVGFVTLGNDSRTRVHYILAIQEEVGWQVMWLSDEEPDWWFNATNATLTVNTTLTQLVVIGEASGTTRAFYEEVGSPLRKFRVEWLRQENDYILSPPVGTRADRQSWLWSVAQPSAYATLVEFVERLQQQDTSNAAHLVADERLVSLAMAFGLYLPERRYEIIAHDDRIIAFGDRRGTFVATFARPQADDDPWLITDLKPLGAPSSVSTP